MAEFNADKLNERLEQLNREQLATMEKLVEELLKEMKEGKPVPKRSEDTGSSPPPQPAGDRRQFRPCARSDHRIQTGRGEDQICKLGRAHRLLQPLRGPRRALPA